MLPLTPLRKFLMPIFPFILVNLSFKNLIFEAFWASKFSQPLETNSILCCKIEKWPPLNQLCWQKLLQKKKVFNVLAPFVEQHQVCFCQNQIHSFILWNWLLLIQGGRKLYISTRHPDTALLSWPGVMLKVSKSQKHFWEFWILTKKTEQKMGKKHLES